MCDGIAKTRCGEASQHLNVTISSGVTEFHISCMNTIATKFMLDSCLQLSVSTSSPVPHLAMPAAGLLIQLSYVIKNRNR